VLVKDCLFSGAHDDAINIHGTGETSAAIARRIQTRLFGQVCIRISGFFKCFFQTYPARYHGFPAVDFNLYFALSLFINHFNCLIRTDQRTCPAADTDVFFCTGTGDKFQACAALSAFIQYMAGYLRHRYPLKQGRG